MTWATRFKLFFGTLGVVVIVAALTYVYTERESHATSATATVTATTLPVGTDYGGKIVEQHVEAGSHVVEGDVLFTIDSLARQQDLEREANEASLAASAESSATDSATTASAAGAESSATEQSTAEPNATEPAASVPADNDRAGASSAEFSPLWEVTASTSGTIAEVPTGVGGYVPVGGTVAQVYEEGSLVIRADFVLTPRDFDRLEIGAPVDVRMPDRSHVMGTVDEVQVTTEEGAARAFVRVSSAAMAQSDPTGLTAPGTPVTATVELRDDGPLAGLRDTAIDFLEQIGL